MAVPKRKTSKSVGRSRRAHWLHIAAPGKAKCPQCGAPKRPHSVCRQCGTYKGREVIKVGEEA